MFKNTSTINCVHACPYRLKAGALANFSLEFKMSKENDNDKMSSVSNCSKFSSKFALLLAAGLDPNAAFAALSMVKHEQTVNILL